MEFCNDRLLAAGETVDDLTAREKELAATVDAGLGPYESAESPARQLSTIAEVASGGAPHARRAFITSHVRCVTITPAELKLELHLGVSKSTKWQPHQDSNLD